MAVYQAKTLRRSGKITRKLMQQVNDLDLTIRRLKAVIPIVDQMEGDFDFNLLNAYTLEPKFKEFINKLVAVKAEGRNKLDWETVLEIHRDRESERSL